MLDISSFSTLIKLTDFLVGIQHCVTVLDKWIFDINIPFALLSLVTIWTTVVQMMNKEEEYVDDICKYGHTKLPTVT